MKLSIQSIFASVLLASTLVSAVPVLRAESAAVADKNSTAVASNDNKNSAAADNNKNASSNANNENNNNNNNNGNKSGAVFFINNDPKQNFVVAADIGSDGKVALRQAVATGGKGGHGVSDPLGPDALFSQGAVKTNNKANVLANVNAGSNTISLFSVNPNDPALIKKLGTPVNSGGEFPVSLAFNSKGSQLCTLNGGKVNGVACFTVDPKKGLVAQKNNVRSLELKQTTPPSGPGGSVSHVIFSENGKQLIASVKGSANTTGFLAVWDLAADGTLSKNFQKVAPPKGANILFSMTAIKGTNAILTTDPAIGFDVIDFNANGRAAANTSSANEIKGQGATCWSSFSAQTGNFYLTDVVTGEVTEVNVNKNLKAKVVNQYPQGNSSATIDNDIAHINGKDFLYVLAAKDVAIDVLAVNAPGKAQNLQKLSMADIAKKAGLALDGNNLQGMTTFVKA